MIRILDVGLGLLITAIVIASLILLYFIFMVIVFIYYDFFRRSLKLHTKGMMISLVAKYDNLEKLIQFVKTNGEVIDDRLFIIFDSINKNNFSEPGSKKFKEEIEKLISCREIVFYLSRNDEKLKNNKDFELAKQNVIEMDTNYRNTVALYNADVLGYNYWIHFFLTRWMFKLTKIKDKELI